MSNSLRPHGLQPARLLGPWDFPGKNTGVVATSYWRGSSWSRDWTCFSCNSCICRQVLYHQHHLRSPILSLGCSVAKSCPTPSDPMDYSTPGYPIFHHLLELAQTHVHWVSDAIQPSHPLSAPSLVALSLSQHQGLFQWVSSSHQEAKVLEFQLQHQSFQWKFRTDFL